jgi:putative DNA primase/helicase
MKTADINDTLRNEGDDAARERFDKANRYQSQQHRPIADDAAAKSDLPGIIVRSGDRHLAADAGLAAIETAGIQFYRRDRTLVRVCRIKAKRANGEEVFVPAVTVITMPMLSRALGQSARWRKYNHKRELVAIDPPQAIAEQILGMIDDWPFPPLRGVIATQTIRHDGTLLIAPGYDTQTGLVLFEPPQMPPIPEHPCQRDALNALALLNGLLEEFSFADDNDISRSAALSMLMTPVLRGAMPVAPMHVITKPEAGTGGSYLQDLTAAIAIGERCPVISLSPNMEENEKRLMSAAIAQQPIIALDNVSTLLMGDFLCQLTERPLLQPRRLGRAELVNIDNSFCVLANGNNLTTGGDVVRRAIQVALDANLENPETRCFARDPVSEVLADRGRYVAAVLTIARAYRVAGSPTRLPPLASYEIWSDNVRSPLAWLGWADPVASIERIRSEDPVRSARAAVFTAWANELQVNIGYHTSELIAAAERHENGERSRQALWTALFAVAGHKSGHQVVDPAKLGIWLKTNADTIAAGHKLLVDRSDKARPRWRLVPR